MFSEEKNFIYIRLFKNIRIFFIVDTVYAAPAKKTTSGGGTLGRRTRRGHASALSSSSTASDRSETVFPDEHTRIHLTNGKATFRGFFACITAQLLPHTHDHRIISHATRYIVFRQLL